MVYGFCSKFHTFFQQCKNFDIRLRFDKVTESLKVGTFSETQCTTIFMCDQKLYHKICIGCQHVWESLSAYNSVLRRIQSCSASWVNRHRTCTNSTLAWEWISSACSMGCTRLSLRSLCSNFVYWVLPENQFFTLSSLLFLFTGTHSLIWPLWHTHAHTHFVHYAHIHHILIY